MFVGKSQWEIPLVVHCQNCGIFITEEFAMLKKVRRKENKAQNNLKTSLMKNQRVILFLIVIDENESMYI